MARTLLALVFVGLFSLAACGSGTEADRLGVGAECSATDDCLDDEIAECLAFRGGYCGFSGCEDDLDCPGGSACIAHDDGMNYCFLVCIDKIDCNINRSPEHEANCSSNVTFVDGAQGRKACVPPSSS